MRRSLILSLAALSLCQAGCQFLPPQWSKSDDKNAKAAQTAPVGAEPVLYARDGSIVTPSGSSSASGMPRRDVQNGEGTRTKILELYERVVEERDQLRLSLTARESELAQLHQQLARESARANEFETRMHAAELARTELTNQNLDIAGRLTTAQIKRLEAEKKWLELSISLPTKTVAAIENAPTIPPAKPAAKTGGEPDEQH